MAALTGMELAQGIRAGVDQLRLVCEGVGEQTASLAPEGRWSPKEILSHLLGPKGARMITTMQAFVREDVPRIDIQSEQTHFSGPRADMSFQELLVEVEREYDGIAGYVERLSPQELSRKAHVPILKETPFGDHPTLETWINLIGASERSHLQSHVGHMREILEALGVPAR